MSSPVERLTALARKPGRQAPDFDLVVALGFYDGPEEGLALYRSGDAVRFSTLGESRSRMFRAYALEVLDGMDWWRMALRVPEVANLSEPRGMCLPSVDSEALAALERSVGDASAIAHFIAVGDAYLQCLGVLAVQEDDVRAMRQMNDWPLAFRQAHRLVKERFRA